MAEITIDDVIKKYVSLREERSVLKKAYEREDEVLKDKQDRIEKWLLEMQKKLGVTQFKSPHGIAYQVPKTLYSCVDWGVFHNWIRENNRLDLLEKRPLQGGLKEYREETGTIPPGLNVFSKIEVNIRKGE